MNKNTLYCGNCGKYGHVYRKCLAPIISSGVILFKKESNTIKYLLVQRKDTLGFVEFMRGKYNLENIQYITKLFEILTEKERLLLIGYDTECKLEPRDKDIFFGLISLRWSFSIVALNAIELKYFGLISFLAIKDFVFEKVPSDIIR